MRRLLLTGLLLIPGLGTAWIVGHAADAVAPDGANSRTRAAPCAVALERTPRHTALPVDALAPLPPAMDPPPLPDLEPPREPAPPALEELLDRLRGVDEAAIWVTHAEMIRHGPAALPGLLDALRHPLPRVRLFALNAIQGIGGSDEGLGEYEGTVARATVAATADPDEDVAETAGNVAGEIDAAHPLLTALARQGDVSRRVTALRVLFEGSVADDHRAEVSLAHELFASDETPAAVRQVAGFWWAVALGNDPALADLARVPPEVTLWGHALLAEEVPIRGDEMVGALAYVAQRGPSARAELLSSIRAGLEYTATSAAGHLLAHLDPPPIAELIQLGRSSQTPLGRAAAIEVLGALAVEERLGEHAGAVEALLIDALSDDDEVAWDARYALDSLADSGHDVLPSLLAALEARPEARSTALWTIDALGTDALRAAAPTLRAIVADESADEAVRREALAVLSRRDTESAADAALTAAQSRSVTIRRNVTLTLSRLRPLAPGVEGALRRALADPDVEVRLAAAGSYWLQRGESREFLDVLVAALGESEERIVLLAANALPKGDGDQLLPYLPTLVSALRGEDAGLRHPVVAAIGRIGPPAADMAARRLAAELHAATTGSARAVVARALNAIGWRPNLGDAPLLVAMIGRRPQGWRGPPLWGGGPVDRDLLELLAPLGREIEWVVPGLIERARAVEKDAREVYVAGVGNHAVGRPETVAFLLEELRGGDAHRGCTNWYSVPAAAAGALGRIGARGREALPFLRAIAADPRRDHYSDVSPDEAAAAITGIEGSPSRE